MRFTDRTDAGQRLAVALEGYREARPVVLALPRGGVPVGAEIATALGAPLDLVLVRKLGVPGEPELAMGAIVDGNKPVVMRNEGVIAAIGISEAGFQSVCRHELAEIDRRRKRYVGGRARVDIAGRTVIMVDDGLATGATARAAIDAIRKDKPRKIVLAVPVAPNDTLAAMQAEADDVVCLESHDLFGSIGAYYENFDEVSDEEVIAALGNTEPLASN